GPLAGWAGVPVGDGDVDAGGAAHPVQSGLAEPLDGGGVAAGAGLGRGAGVGGQADRLVLVRHGRLLSVCGVAPGGPDVPRTPTRTCGGGRATSGTRSVLL